MTGKSAKAASGSGVRGKPAVRAMGVAQAASRGVRGNQAASAIRVFSAMFFSLLFVSQFAFASSCSGTPSCAGLAACSAYPLPWNSNAKCCSQFALGYVYSGTGCSPTGSCVDVIANSNCASHPDESSCLSAGYPTAYCNWARNTPHVCAGAPSVPCSYFSGNAADCAAFGCTWTPDTIATCHRSYGNTPGFGTCSGTYDLCSNLDGTCCPAAYCVQNGFACGGTSMQDCAAFKDNHDNCVSRTGCTWTPAQCAAPGASCPTGKNCCSGACSGSAGAGTCVTPPGSDLPPSAPVITLDRSVIMPGFTIVATASGSIDPNGDAVHYNFNWVIDGQNVQTDNGATFSSFACTSPQCDAGKTLTVAVTAWSRGTYQATGCTGGSGICSYSYANGYGFQKRRTKQWTASCSVEVPNGCASGAPSSCTQPSTLAYGYYCASLPAGCTYNSCGGRLEGDDCPGSALGYLQSPSQGNCGQTDSGYACEGSFTCASLSQAQCAAVPNSCQWQPTLNHPILSTYSSATRLVMKVPAPPAPLPPSISPLAAASLTSQGKASCTAACPPSPIPTDPVTHAAASMEYQWGKNGAPIGPWGYYSQFNCAAASCAVGDSIRLSSRACGTVCGDSAQSNALVVAPPPAPPAPVIGHAGAVLLPSGTTSCTNCPLSGAGTIHYAWARNNAAEAWAAAASPYDCAAKGCAVGDTIHLKARACQTAAVSSCGFESQSNTVTVRAAPPPPANLDMSYSILAILSALLLIALGYMATYMLNMPQIRGMLRDELLQAVASGAVLLMVVAVAASLDGYMVSMMKAADPSGSYATLANAMDGANAVLQGNTVTAQSVYDSILDRNVEIGKQGSKNMFCTFLGTGFSMNNCAQLNAFRGSLTTAAFVASTALTDLYAQQALLSLARNISFALLIPMGLFFRCFRFSRSAGGALIAIGLGFYTVFPVMTVVTDRVLHRSAPALQQLPIVEECDPEETDNDFARNYILGFAGELSDFSRVESIIYFVIVKVVFSSLFNLMVTLGFIRAFAKAIGSDIDVSSLARIA